MCVLAERLCGCAAPLCESRARRAGGCCSQAASQSLALLLFLSTLLRFQLHIRTHTHTLLAGGWVSVTFSGCSLSGCALTLHTQTFNKYNTHPADTVYVLHFAPLVHTCSAFFLFDLQYNGRNTTATPFCVATSAHRELYSYFR
jgi:hypothetical protein